MFMTVDPHHSFDLRLRGPPGHIRDGGKRELIWTRNVTVLRDRTINISGTFFTPEGQHRYIDYDRVLEC